MSMPLTDTAPAAEPENDLIRNVTVQTLKTALIEPSMTRLVIVDFWAPWCEPCKQLTPLLEKLVLEQKGAVLLAKINIEESPQIAQQMRIQSIPAVFAFYQGQPVDGFMGVQPEAQLRKWLEKLIKATGAIAPSEHPDLDSALKQAADYHALGEIEMAQGIYADIVAEHPDNVEAFAGLLRTALDLGQTDAAQEKFDAAPEAMKTHKLLVPIKAALELAAQTTGAAEGLQGLLDLVAKNPDDHQARFDLAMASYAAGSPERAVDELLEIVRRNRAWNDEAARKQLIKFFEAFGFNHPLSIEGRKRLSTLLFS